MSISTQPAASSESTLLSDALDVFNVLHDPVGVFNRIKQRPRILAPWIVLSIAAIILGILTAPYQKAAMDVFKATLAPEQAARMGNRGSGGVLGYVLTPAIVLLFLAIGSGFLWIGVSLTGTQAKFKTLLSVLAYAAVTYLLFAAVGIVVLTVRGQAAITGFADLRAPLGLDLLAPNVGLYAGAVLNGINPFSVWGVWLTGTGISITHGTSRGSSILATAVVYVICLLIMAAPTLFLGMMTKQ
jgi:hypothetical protein